MLLSSQNQTSHLVGARSASNQHISGCRHSSPLPTGRFNSYQHQSLNQRTQFPIRSSGQPSPHGRIGGAYGGVGAMTSLASSQSPMYSMATTQQDTSQIMSQSPSTLTPIQTSGSSHGPVAATVDQRGISTLTCFRPLSK